MPFIKRLFLFIGLCTMMSFTHADNLDKFIKTIGEQEIIAQWVTENSNTKLSDSTALSIVRHTYTNAISNNIKPEVILAMIKTESGFIAKAKSSYGAKGLLQVVPRWHKDKLKGRDPFSPSVSIEVGTTVLKDCLVKHNSNFKKSMRCYSGGAGPKYARSVIKYQSSILSHLKEINSNKPYLVAGF